MAFFSFSLVAPLLAIAALFALSVSDRLLRPVAALSDAIARIGSGARRAPYLANRITSYNVCYTKLLRPRSR